LETNINIRYLCCSYTNVCHRAFYLKHQKFTQAVSVWNKLPREGYGKLSSLRRERLSKPRSEFQGWWKVTDRNL